MNEQALGAQDAHHHEEASKFPPIVGVGAPLMLLGLGAHWNNMPWGLGLNLLGTAILLAGMIGWWWELIEQNKKDEVTLIGTPEQMRKLLKLGFAFFIGSEVMFFAAFFAYYFYIRGIAPSWPPLGYDKLPIVPAIINTALLVSSGVCFHFAEHGLIHKKSKSLVVGLLVVAVLLGAIFLGVQAQEWMELMHHGFHINDGTMGTAFYLLTGFHGFHVIIGAIFLTVVLVRVILNHFTPEKHFAMTAAGWYWHFVDVVWIGLVLCLYVF